MLISSLDAMSFREEISQEEMKGSRLLIKSEYSLSVFKRTEGLELDPAVGCHLGSLVNDQAGPNPRCAVSHKDHKSWPRKFGQ